MQRRALIHGVGVAVVGLSAGCLGEGEESSEPVSTDSETGMPQGVDADRLIEVSGRRYEFSPESEEPIVAELDEEVHLIFRSLDDGYHGGHGFAIDAYGIDLRAEEGEETATTFVADQPGEFEVRCSVYCGEGHPSMTGTFIVEEPTA